MTQTPEIIRKTTSLTQHTPATGLDIQELGHWGRSSLIHCAVWSKYSHYNERPSAASFLPYSHNFCNSKLRLPIREHFLPHRALFYKLESPSHRLCSDNTLPISSHLSQKRPSLTTPFPFLCVNDRILVCFVLICFVLFLRSSFYPLPFSVLSLSYPHQDFHYFVLYQ